MTDTFQRRLCEATIEKMLEATSEALTVDYAAIKQAVHAAPVKHLDETGFRIGGKLHWMHVIATKTDSFYGRARNAVLKARWRAALWFTTFGDPIL